MLLPWNAEFSSIQFWDEHYSSPFTHDHLCDRRAARTHQIKDFVVIEPGFLTSLPEIDSAKIERVAKPNAFSRRASSIKFSTAMKAPPFGSAAYADLISCFFFSRFQSCNIIPNGNHIRLGCTLSRAKFCLIVCRRHQGDFFKDPLPKLSAVTAIRFFGKFS